MSIDHNARTPRQKKLVESFVDRFSDEKPNSEVTFDGLKVEVLDRDTGELDKYGNYAAFQKALEAEEQPTPTPVEDSPEPEEREVTDDDDESFEPDDDEEDFDLDEDEEGDYEVLDVEGGDVAQPEATAKSVTTTEAVGSQEGFDESDEEEAEGDDADELAGRIQEALEEEVESDEEPEPEEEEPEDDEIQAEGADDAEARAESARAGLQEVDEGDRKVADDEFDNLIADMTETVLAERHGEIEKNEARWRKGGHVDRVDDIANRYRQAGNRDLGSRARILEVTRRAVEEQIESKGVIEQVSRMTETELSFVKKAFVTFAKLHGGSSAQFKLEDQLDRNGNPLVSDAGEPYVKRIGEIALNKAYYLADFAIEANRDRILSFAFTYSEGVCKGLAKLLRERDCQNFPERVDGILDAFYAEQQEIEAEDTGETVKINMGDQGARDYLRKKIGDDTPAVKSIKIDAGLYEGLWRDTVQYASVVWKWLENDVHPQHGTIRNTVLLERILKFFDPNDNQFANIVHLFVESGDMTQEQAETFLEEHADFDPNELEGSES